MEEKRHRQHKGYRWRWFEECSAGLERHAQAHLNAASRGCAAYHSKTGRAKNTSRCAEIGMVGQVEELAAKLDDAALAGQREVSQHAHIQPEVSVRAQDVYALIDWRALSALPQEC